MKKASKQKSNKRKAAGNSPLAGLLKYPFIQNLLKKADPDALVCYLWEDAFPMDGENFTTLVMESGGEIEFFEMCLDVYRQFSDGKDDVAWIQQSMGRALEREGRYAEAIAALEAARPVLFSQKHCDKDEYMKDLAALYTKVGNVKKAAECQKLANDYGVEDEKRAAEHRAAKAAEQAPVALPKLSAVELRKQYIERRDEAMNMLTKIHADELAAWDAAVEREEAAQIGGGR